MPTGMTWASATPSSPCSAQEDAYAEACARHGIKVDSARYTQGWIEGKYEADQRHPQPTH